MAIDALPGDSALAPELATRCGLGPHGASIAVARGLALFIGGFSLLNLLGDLRYPRFDANLWWIDLRPMGPGLSRAILAAASVLLLAYGVRPACRSWRRMLTSMLTTVLPAVADGVLFRLGPRHIQDALTGRLQDRTAPPNGRDTPIRSLPKQQEHRKTQELSM